MSMRGSVLSFLPFSNFLNFGLVVFMLAMVSKESGLASFYLTQSSPVSELSGISTCNVMLVLFNLKHITY